ncbi:hypothetical protein QFZ67_005002 [Streptomyces sp. V1I1]|nr:hypothetical protein [Streptomyces sp. V1I1]
MNTHALFAVIAVCLTAMFCVALWAAVRINQTKDK